MIFDLVGMWLLDGGIAAVFNSPFVVPVAGCAMILGISATSIWARVRSQEIKSHERLARIAQGLPVETWEEATAPAPVAQGTSSRGTAVMHAFDRMNDGSGPRRAGIVLVSIGLGLFLFFAALSAIVQVREVLAGGAGGLIPLAIGVGFLIDARMKRQEYERRLAAGWYAMPNAGDATGQAPPPPPQPPAGMSAAQASDWRPLH